MYEELKAALEDIQGISFAEYAWATRPNGNHGTIQLDFHADADRGDDLHQDQAWEGSVDIWTHGNAPEIAGVVEDALEEICEGAWELNSIQVDDAVKMLHREYVFQIEVI